MADERAVAVVRTTTQVWPWRSFGCLFQNGRCTTYFCRSLVSAEHGRLLPVSALMGAILLNRADVLPRTVNAPEDLPIGVVTALGVGVCLIALPRFERRR
jgi:ABC-type cobalamin transport system permease subunit